MAEEESLKIDPNRADAETLQKLPGIGPSLARKIMDARPFAGADDLMNVRGLGKVLLERVKPFLMFEESEKIPKDNLKEEGKETKVPTDRQPADELETSIISSDGQKEGDLKDSRPVYEAQEDVEPRPERADDKDVQEKPKVVPVKKTRLVRAFSRTETIWLVVSVGVLILIVSLLINLAIIGGINGTLDFNRLQAVEQLEKDLSVLEGDLESLTSTVDTFDQRITPLEGLTGRMTSVETLMDTLEGDVEDALASVDAMQSDLETLSNETTRLSGRVDRFDSFLEGMRQLINEIFAAPAADELPES